MKCLERPLLTPLDVDRRAASRSLNLEFVAVTSCNVAIIPLSPLYDSLVEGIFFVMGPLVDGWAGAGCL